MGWFSLLPEDYSYIETWFKRLFLLFGIIVIGPWISLLVYDLLLYIVRSVAYEVPVVGGKARGRARPRAPSLTERPSGHRRRFSFAQRGAILAVQDSSTSKSGDVDMRHRALQEEGLEKRKRDAGGD